jgi:hypothetical protein
MAQVILTVTLYDKEGFEDKINKLEQVLGLPVNSGYGLGQYDASWKFDSVEEALEAEKVVQSIIGGPEYGEVSVLEPDVEIY